MVTGCLVDGVRLPTWQCCMTWYIEVNHTFHVVSSHSNPPEKLLNVAALIVITTLKSPFRSAYNSNNTAARLLTGNRSHNGKGGGLNALSLATAACHPRHQSPSISFHSLTPKFNSQQKQHSTAPWSPFSSNTNPRLPPSHFLPVEYLKRWDSNSVNPATPELPSLFLPGLGGLE